MTLSQVSLPDKPSFAGIFEDGSSIFNDNLSDLAQVPGLTYIVKIVYVAYNLRKFTLVESSGVLRFLKIGDFELRDIGGEVYDKYDNDHKTDITFYDYRDNELRRHRIKTSQSAQIMMAELVNLLKEIDDARSYLAFVKLTKLNEIEKENERLKDDNRQLSQTILELRSQLNAAMQNSNFS